jgi:endonuclease YncB( thermonuclease family)
MRTHSQWLLVGAALLAVGAAWTCVPQERISGRPKIVDGDSFEIDDVGIRLFGVDAPEAQQDCARDGRSWRCGAAAETELRRLVGSATIVCRKEDTDSYGRIVARCSNGSTDLAAAMARAGFAVAYRRYSYDYVDEEREAKAAKRGIWAGEFTPPEEYRRDADTPTQRRGEPATPSTPPSPRCRIKGNISGEGERIYHTPDSPSYDATVIDEIRGERWFCSEAQARAAGWRAPR